LSTHDGGEPGDKEVRQKHALLPGGLVNGGLLDELGVVLLSHTSADPIFL